MMLPIRASIIIVSYNSASYLKACLDSILAQISDKDELIVVDNGSSDGSAALVAESYPQVQLIRSTNLGYAAGNNHGARAAQGEFLVFLNPDTSLETGTIDALLAPFVSQPDIGMTTARIVLMHDPEHINTCGNTMHYSGLTYCRGAGRHKADFARSSDVDAVSGAAFAIRRSLFEQLGGFDERFFMYVEDTDLSWRVHMAGMRCFYVADAIVRHDYRPGLSPQKSFYLDRNRHLMLLKNLSLTTYFRMLPGLFLAEIVTWGFLLIQGPRFWTVKPRVYLALWHERNTIAAIHRRSMPKKDQEQSLIVSLTYRLEFGQLANQHLARIAELIFHPAFRAARVLFAGERP